VVDDELESLVTGADVREMEINEETSEAVARMRGQATKGDKGTVNCI
jgi:hypothetical protein